MLVLLSLPKDLNGLAAPATPGESLDVTAPQTDSTDESTDRLNDDVVVDHDETVEKHGSRFLQKLMLLGIAVAVIMIVVRSRQNSRGRFAYTKSMV